MWTGSSPTHTSSIGVIYLTVLNLPHTVRYKRQNVITVGIIPGPHEPKENINSFLKPLVEELQLLWKGVKLPIQIGSCRKEELIRCAILCVSCDIPAGRKTCGFLGHGAKLGCSRCLKLFPGEVGKKNYSGFDRSEWDKRNNEQQRRAVQQVTENSKTKTRQKELESLLGCRYSCFLDLPYFDAPHMLCIDPMLAPLCVSLPDFMQAAFIIYHLMMCVLLMYSLCLSVEELNECMDHQRSHRICIYMAICMKSF